MDRTTCSPAILDRPLLRWMFRIGTENQIRNVDRVERHGKNHLECLLCDTGVIPRQSTHFRGQDHVRRFNTVRRLEWERIQYETIFAIKTNIGLPTHPTWRSEAKALLFDLLMNHDAIAGRSHERERVAERALDKYHLMEKISLLELALWKARICDGVTFQSMQEMREHITLDANFDARQYAHESRIKCGSGVVIPLVLAYLGYSEQMTYNTPGRYSAYNDRPMLRWMFRLGTVNQIRRVDSVEMHGKNYLKCLLCNTRVPRQSAHFVEESHVWRFNTVRRLEWERIRYEAIVDLKTNIGLPTHCTWRTEANSLLFDVLINDDAIESRSYMRIVVAERALKKFQRMEKISLLELALWKAKICDGVMFQSMQEIREHVPLEANFDAPQYAQESRTQCGTGVVIPLVITYLGREWS